MEVTINTAESYEIEIGTNIFSTHLKKQLEGKTYFLCIDERVLLFHRALFKPFIDKAKAVYILTAEETNKTQKTVEQMLALLTDNMASRQDTLVAIGGGIVGDVSGYVASMYMRGIPFIQIPTTLLSQVDSSIGGKVAINYRGIKNMLGTFYSPKHVIIDTAFLTTLTERLFKSGLVELLKHGFIKDETILDTVLTAENIAALRADSELLITLIKKSLAVKKQLVEADFFDTGSRHLLNFGHTFAHALETSDNVALYHGECVAIGMLVSSYISEEQTSFERLKTILERFACIRQLPEIEYEKVLFDKKRAGSLIKEIFLPQIGQPIIKKVDVQELQQAFKEAYVVIKADTTIKIQQPSFVFAPVTLKGTVYTPPSKSYAHRYLIGAALSNEPTTLTDVYELSDDVRVTMEAIKQLGASVSADLEKGVLHIIPGKLLENNSIPTVAMKESGTSLRLLLPILVQKLTKVRLVGENKLPTRPMEIYYENLKAVTFTKETAGLNLPLICDGEITAGSYKIPGHISSQFISGLLFVLPLLKEDSEIVMSTPLESIPYVEMTLEVLAAFGIQIEITENYEKMSIKGNQVFKSTGSYQIEQDYSSRCFFEVADSFPKHSIKVLPKRGKTLQGDAVLFDIIHSKEQVLDLQHVPDTAPIASIAFTQFGGKMKRTERLQYKESDRLQAICDMLDKMGIVVERDDNNHTLKIAPGIITGGSFDTYKDHRITMSLIIASTLATTTIEITEVESVKKSYKNFIKHYEELGGFVDEK